MPPPPQGPASDEVYLALLARVDAALEENRAAPLGGGGEAPPTTAGAPSLELLFQALGAHASKFRALEHGSLLERLLGARATPWGLAPSASGARVAWLSLAHHLAVAQGGGLFHNCVEFLARALLGGPRAGDGGGEWPAERETEARAQVRTAVARVLEGLPTSHSHFLEECARQCPHVSRPAADLCRYVAGVAWLAGGPGRALAGQLLWRVAELLVELDVSIKWKEIVDRAALAQAAAAEEEVEPEVELQEADLFDMMEEEEDDGDCSEEGLGLSREQRAGLGPGGPGGGGSSEAGAVGWGGGAGAEAGGAGGAAARDWGAGAGAAAAAASAGGLAPAEGARGGAAALVSPPGTVVSSTVDETADKLDSLMELTFGFLEEEFKEGAGERAFGLLLPTFMQVILPAHRSKFAQFLIFYACARHPREGSRAFLDQLLITVQDHNRPSLLRAAAVAYLASFLARAAFVPLDVALDALHKLAGVCEIYVRRHATATADNSSSDDHELFYSSVQGLLYALCYLQHPCVRQGCRVDLQRLPLGPILRSPLAPLQVCLPSVAGEFAKQVADLGLEGWMPPPPTSYAEAAAGPARSRRALEMFFPFDPYLLHRSIRYLRPARWFVDWTAALEADRGGSGEGTFGGGDGLGDVEPEESEEPSHPLSALQAAVAADSGSSGLDSDSSLEDDGGSWGRRAGAGVQRPWGASQHVPVPIAQFALGGGLKRPRGVWQPGGSGYSTSPLMGSSPSDAIPGPLGSSPLGSGPSDANGQPVPRVRPGVVYSPSL